MKYNIFKALIDGLNLQYFQNQIIQNPIDFSQEEQNLKQQLRSTFKAMFDASTNETFHRLTMDSIFVNLEKDDTYIKVPFFNNVSKNDLMFSKHLSKILKINAMNIVDSAKYDFSIRFSEIMNGTFGGNDYTKICNSYMTFFRNNSFRLISIEIMDVFIDDGFLKINFLYDLKYYNQYNPSYIGYNSENGKFYVN